MSEQVVNSHLRHNALQERQKEAPQRAAMLTYLESADFAQLAARPRFIQSLRNSLGPALRTGYQKLA